MQMSISRSLKVVQLGLRPWQEALALQEAANALLQEDDKQPVALVLSFFIRRARVFYEQDTLMLVQHPPIYTLGKRLPGNPQEEKFLRSFGADYQKVSTNIYSSYDVQANRGGEITFHGPGQLVAYPIVRLKRYNVC